MNMHDDDALGPVFAALAAREPPESLRARFEAMLGGLRPDEVWVRADGGLWLNTRCPGLRVKPLLHDARDDRRTMIARMSAGCVYPTHRHEAVEELCVLEGEALVHGIPMRAGDFCIAAAGSMHDAITSTPGATFVVASSPRDAPTRGGAPTGHELTFEMASEGRWSISPWPGVEVRTLLCDAEAGLHTWAARLAPGASLRTSAGLQALVLRGDATLAERQLGEGDYGYVARGGAALRSPGGCEVLVIDAPSDWRSEG